MVAGLPADDLALTTPPADAMDVLIVDDNSQMRAVIRALIDPLGFRVVECADGDEAVARYAELRPAWVLMDVTMQRMDGITATRRIRADHPDAQVLMLTEHADPGLRQAAFEAGASGYVLKEHLFEILDHVAPPTRAG